MGSRNGFGPQVTTGKPERITVPPPVPVPPEPEEKPEKGNGAIAKPDPKKAAPKPVKVVRDLSDVAAAQGAQITPQQHQGLQKWSRRARLGGPSVHMTMTCRGPACVFHKQCPLVKEGIAEPLDQECPVEEHLHEAWTQDFLEGLHVDAGHPDYVIITSLVSEMAMDLKIQNRVAWHLAQDPAAIRKEVVGVNNNGDIIEVEKVNPGLEFLNRLGSKRLRLLREILATPRSKAEAGRMGWKDPGTQAASAQARAEELRRLAGKREGDNDGELPVRLTEIHLGAEEEDGVVRDDDDAAQSGGEDVSEG